jgi:hypothetical protein
MVSWRLLVLVGIASGLGSVSTAAESSVKPMGVYALSLPGFSSPDAKPKAQLWCQGNTLLGFVVPEDKNTECGTPAHKGPAPRALLLRDGRCDADGGPASFGFLESRKSWVFDAAGKRRVEHNVWLLHRFEGTLKSGRLKGALVQVDINHPGSPFQKKDVEIEALPDEQTSFSDEAGWRSGTGQAFCVATGEP